MSFIAAGIGAAGLALTVADKAGVFGDKGATRPAFDYTSANAEAQNYTKQLAAQKEYEDRQMAESERQKAAIAAERDRQQAFTGQANTDLQHEQGLYANVPGQMDAKKATLADFFAANSSGLPQGGPTSPNAMPASKSSAVLADATGKLGRVADYNTQQDNALAGLRSFGDVWSDAGRAATQDKTDLGKLMNFKAGSKSLLPAEITPAYQLTPPPTPQANFGGLYSDPVNSNILPTLLQGAGGIATSAGLSGFNPFSYGALPSSGLGGITGSAAGNAAAAFGPVIVGG